MERDFLAVGNFALLNVQHGISGGRAVNAEFLGSVNVTQCNVNTNIMFISQNCLPWAQKFDGDLFPKTRRRL